MKTAIWKYWMLLLLMAIPLPAITQELEEWNPGLKTYHSIKEASGVTSDSVAKLYLFASKDLDNVSAVCQFRNLVGLELGDMFDDKFPPCIGNLRKLVYLNLRNNKLTTLPAELINLKELQVLNLYWNENLKYIKGLDALKKLQIIDLGGNPMLDLKEVCLLLSKLPNLKSVSLTFNRISNLPPEIGLLTQIEELDLGNNLLKSVPKELAGMKNLKRIVLTNNTFTSVPEVFHQLPSLKEIDLANTYEEDLDTSLAGKYGHNNIPAEHSASFSKANKRVKLVTK